MKLHIVAVSGATVRHLGTFDPSKKSARREFTKRATGFLGYHAQFLDIIHPHDTARAEVEFVAQHHGFTDEWYFNETAFPCVSFAGWLVTCAEEQH